ncbi:MAG: hypothetical protein P4L45_13090 [Ignavibacteriaceae bacterium]|nr:hypothetical protein [Ignavibacteriaceae bacterium]
MKIKFIQVSILTLLLTFLCSHTQYGQVANYPSLSESYAMFQGDPGKWDADKVHTLSVVEVNKDGYKYWGYYGLCYYGGDPSFRKCGIVRSNDLMHWDKFAGNPIINGDCRWPTVVYTNSVFYMFYAEYNSDNDSRIVMVSSKDGINFSNKVEVVAREKGKQNQNPFIYLDKKDKNFYLVYYSGVERGTDTTKYHWDIKIKKSKSIQKIAAAKPKVLLTSTYTLAAPSIAFYNDKYYLLVEAAKEGKWNDQWVTLGYAGNKPDGKYKEVANDEPPVLHNNDACAFQYVFDNELYVFYSHCLDLPKWNWELRMVKAIK